MSATPNYKNRFHLLKQGYFRLITVANTVLSYRDIQCRRWLLPSLLRRATSLPDGGLVTTPSAISSDLTNTHNFQFIEPFPMRRSDFDLRSDLARQRYTRVEAPRPRERIAVFSRFRRQHSTFAKQMLHTVQRKPLHLLYSRYFLKPGLCKR